MPSAASSRQLPNLPAGFRFHPTDEELIVHYLMNQAAAVPCPVPIIAEVNIYHCNPWDLPAKALFGENEWYFFSPRDRKYPNGARPNRAAGTGYWKATGTDKAILSSSLSSAAGAASESVAVGVKKALVFYSGKPPKGVKTDWIMHEYRLTATPSHNKTTAATTTKRRGSSSMRLDDWVLCRIYKKSNDFQFQLMSDQEQDGGSTVEEEGGSSLHTTTNAAALPPSSSSSPKSEAAFDHDQFRQTAMAMMTKSCSLTDLLNTIDCSVLSQMLLDAPPAAAAEPHEPPQQISPLVTIYPKTTTTAAAQITHQAALNFNVMTNNISHVNFSPVDASPGGDNNNHHNNNGLNKRKRTMAAAMGTECFDDGSKKLKMMMPSDSRSGAHFGSASSSSYYCNQQQLADTTTGGGVFQYSSLLMSNPFFNQQLLLSSHLEMQ